MCFLLLRFLLCCECAKKASVSTGSSVRRGVLLSISGNLPLIYKAVQQIKMLVAPVNIFLRILINLFPRADEPTAPFRQRKRKHDCQNLWYHQ